MAGGYWAKETSVDTHSRPSTVSSTQAVKPENAYNGRPFELMTAIGSVVLSGGQTGVILAAPGSSEGRIAKLPVGTVVVMRLGGGANQVGNLKGDEQGLREGVTADPTMFHAYQSESPHFSGQLLAVTIDKATTDAGIPCDEPVYCVRPPQNGGEGSYAAYIFGPEAYDNRLLTDMQKDVTLGLGTQVETRHYNASEITP